MRGNEKDSRIGVPLQEGRLSPEDVCSWPCALEPLAKVISNTDSVRPLGHVWFCYRGDVHYEFVLSFLRFYFSIVEIWEARENLSFSQLDTLVILECSYIRCASFSWSIF